MSAVPADLIEAYRAAIYEVEVAPGRYVPFRIGQINAALDELLSANGAREAAFVTAYNPASMRLCESENQAAQENLLQDIRRRDFKYLTARGIDPDRRWPDEPGFVVLAIPRKEAAQLASQFEQNGFVYLAPGVAPELVLVR